MNCLPLPPITRPPLVARAFSGSAPVRRTSQRLSQRCFGKENFPPESSGARASLNWELLQVMLSLTLGYLHFQAIFATAKKASLASLTKIFGTGIWFELSRSEAAIDYCCKEDTRVEGPWEYGCKPFRRNSPTDWEDVWLAAKSGDLLRIPASIRVVSYRTLRAIGSDFAVPQPIIRTVFVYWGSSGTGKSRRAWEEAGLDAYCKDPRSKFWDGYGDQQNIVVDEFRGGIDIAHILRWCDRYPVRVEIKGSSRPLVAVKIWFTSNVDPRLWYPDLDPDSLEALMRRFNITHFN